MAFMPWLGGAQDEIVKVTSAAKAATAVEAAIASPAVSVVSLVFSRMFTPLIDAISVLYLSPVFPGEFVDLPVGLLCTRPSVKILPRFF
jgi:hypothetical protein